MSKRYLVEVTRTAERDALSIHDYIDRDSPGRGAKWFTEIQSQMRTLSQSPKRCPIIPEVEEIGVEYRHLNYGNYRTVFRIQGNTVWVVRIVHSAQLLDTSRLETRD